MRWSLYLAFVIYTLRELQASPVIQTTNGLVSGDTITFEGKKVDAFLGIPYAEPPIGDLRFRAPQPVKNWTETLNAVKMPKACFQLPQEYIEEMSEDCLYLNIWTPASQAKESPISVLVWIYGGAFKMGSVAVPHYDGRVLAAFTDVVVVTLNYRLGAFGFLNSLSEDAPGNMGILDQNLALRWISENIKAFGGDPEKITIFGESAGSMSVHMHLMSHLSKGLFKRAIMQSGTQFNPEQIHTPEKSIQTSNELSETLLCANETVDLYTNPSEVVECLRREDSLEIINATEKTFPGIVAPFYPTYRDTVLSVSPMLASKRGMFYNGDLLIGTNSDEGSLFLSGAVAPKYLQSSLANFTTDEVLQAFKLGVWFRTETYFSHYENFYLNNSDSQGKDGIRKAASDFLSDNRFVCPTVFLSERYSDRDNNVYMYQFSHRSSNKDTPEWKGVQHGDEIPYVFGIPFVKRPRFTDEDRSVSQKMMKIWTDFAKTGKPTSEEFEWPLYSRTSLKYVDLNTGELTVKEGPRREFCDYWRPIITA